MIRVTVFNEYVHERNEAKVREVYPNGIHGAIAQALGGIEDITVKCVTMDMPENGLPQQLLDETDVLIWWAHLAHNQVSDEVARRVQRRVLDGMGFVALHSAHASKPFSLLLGTRSPVLRWRENDEQQRVWCVSPGHPIAAGLGESFVIPKDETYGEYFEIPTPDELVFISWFSGGNVFRSGCCWKRGAGKIFYFQGGHETYPIYYQTEVKRVIQNAVRWAAPTYPAIVFNEARCEQIPPVEQ
ncbi:MAG TPA: ThuA domain-containing protein [Candidatus Faecaligallichristensenella faecipullorum]|nr:ThuA domain-containing protein [Candidatus Faecaligallichristensenella faecipullorum]